MTAEGGEVPQRLALLLQTHDRVLLEHLARRLPRPLDHQTPLEHLHTLFLLMICNRGRIRFWEKKIANASNIEEIERLLELG